jgi:hypothetical protein
MNSFEVPQLERQEDVIPSHREIGATGSWRISSLTAAAAALRK